jgi:four helix bundle protein
LFELETQLLLAKQLQYISDADSATLLESVAAMARSLTGLINSLTAQVA